MTAITLHTEIAAPPERCFDLSRDLDIHVRSMEHSSERVVGGRATGMLGLGEEVTWEARHFGTVLAWYLERLPARRNAVIKREAES